jgi:hypothetical protein
MPRLRTSILAVAMAATLRAQSPLLEELTADDWQRRNAAAAQLCGEAGQLDEASRAGLWELAADPDPFTWAAVPTHRTAHLRLTDSSVLHATERVATIDDLVPGSPDDLVVGYTTRALALLVLLHVQRPPSADDVAQAVDLATRAVEPAEFELACRLCASFGAPALDAVVGLLRDRVARAGAARSLHAGARVLARLGPRGHSALHSLLAPEVATPLRRAALLAAAEIAPDAAAPTLSAAAGILRHSPELADVAFGTLLAHDVGPGVPAAVAELAEALRDEAADRRQRCAAVLAHWPVAATGRQTAAAILADHLATCSDQELGMLLGAMRHPIATPIPPAVLQRLLAIASAPGAAAARAAQTCLAEAARVDDACLATLLGAERDCLPWLGRILIDDLPSHVDEPLASALLAALATELQGRSTAERLASFRRWQDDRGLCEAPAVQRALQRELTAIDATRVDAAAWFVADHSPRLAALGPDVERLLHSASNVRDSVRHAWLRLHPAELPAALLAGHTTTYAAYRLAPRPQPSDPATRTQLLAMSRDPQLDTRIRHRATAWSTTFGAPAAESFVELLDTGDGTQSQWALYGLRRATAELAGRPARVEALAAALRASLARRAHTQRCLDLSAALAALGKLRPVDLEPVVARIHELPTAQWRTAGLDRHVDLDIRTLEDRWTVEGLIAAIEAVGATPTVLATLVRLGDPGPRASTPSGDDGHVRAIRRLLGKLARRR